jgi:AAA ATPase domain/AAA domain, putative AbiEii toxin, Type IV TA system
MFIKKLRIKNYKGFHDSGEMEFGPGFNVVVGQNNSGKSALLECIRLHGAESKPHRSAKTPKGHQLSPQSVFEFDLTLKKEEFIEIIQRTRQSPIVADPAPNGRSSVRQIIDSELINLMMFAIAGQGAFYTIGGSCLFQNYSHEGNTIQISPSTDKEKVDVSDPVRSGQGDALPATIFSGVANQFYVFKAERLTPGTYNITDESVLLPNAANLAAVLHNCFNNSLKRTREFNEHVTSIFPSIRLIQAPNRSGNLRIKIWTTEPDDDRDDLANFLEDSGTGIGQVLAILYVAMTMPPSVIAIDEPNSFLHPGATKKLLQILKKYEHQYIISTHSTDIIAIVKPVSLHLVRWQDGESKVSTLDPSQIDDMRIVLGEVGVGLSDIFAADQVIWVEGQTEEECFPKLVRHRQGQMPLGLSFLSVIDTGDFDAKDWKARKIWQLYKRLGSANGILPVAAAFSLDSEKRTDAEKREMEKETGGLMHFLPRRAYENYLLCPSAIVAVINAELEADKAVVEDDIHRWIKAKGKEHHSKSTEPDTENWDQWVKECDAAKMLQNMFGDISEATVEYRKTQHSIALTDWLLENAPEALEELIEYVMSLLPNAPSA